MRWKFPSIKIDGSHYAYHDDTRSRARRSKDIEGPFAEVIGEQLLVKVNAIFAQILQGGLSVEEVGDYYVALSNTGYFTEYPWLRLGRPPTMIGFDSRLRQLLKDTDDPRLLQAVTKQLLFNADIESVAMRNLIVESYADSLVMLIGHDPLGIVDDPGNSGLSVAQLEYLDVFEQIVSELKKSIAERTELIEQLVETLAEKLQLQYYLCARLESELSYAFRKGTLERSRRAGQFFEVGLEFITADEQTRIETLNLFTNALTAEALEHYIDHLELRRDEDKRKSVSKGEREFFQSLFENPIGLAYGHFAGNTDFKDPVVRERVRSKIMVAHDNFQSLRLGERSYIVNLIAFPERRYSHTEENIVKYINDALDRILPYDEGNPDSSYNRNVDYARDFVLAYTSQTDIPQR